MGTEIDRLEIQVEAQAASANKQLDVLIAKLNSVSKSMSGINGGGMKQFAEGMNRITAASKTLASVKASDINRVVSHLHKLSTVNSGNMFNVGNALKNFTSGLSGISGVNISSIAQMTNSIAGLSKFGNKGVQTAITSMPQIARAINEMVAALNGQIGNNGAVAQLTSVATAVSMFGQKRIQAAMTMMPQLATALKAFMDTLSKAPSVSNNLIQMTNALTNLASCGAKAKSATSAITSMVSASATAKTKVQGLSTSTYALAFNMGASKVSLKGFSTTLTNVSTKIGLTAVRTKSLSQVFRSFYATLYPIIRGIKLFGKTVEKSMDYIETYNYYSVIMDKIGSEFGSNFAQFGYDSADAYVNSFSGRLNGLTEKMSGFKVGEDGILSFADNKNLGLDPEQLMQYQANISAVTNSVGLVGETSINASKALSMLAADMSSLKNIDMQTVMTNFSSGLIGQSRALYKYGIDITNATLQTYAYKYGIETALQEMTQADKMQLRLLAILDQSKVAWGDQANTINSVANQYRIFKQQISNVARAIGNLLMPALQVILPVVNGVLMAFQKLVVFVGKLFGIDYSKIMDGISGGYSGADDVIGDLVDDTDSVADAADGAADNTDNIGGSIDDASDKAKKLKNALLGIDEINKLPDNSDPVDSSDSGSGKNTGIGESGGAGGIDLSGAIADALANYESIWDKALENSVNKAQGYADRITSVFSNMWGMIKSGDYEGLGEYIASGVDSVFEKINSVFNWERLGPGITEFVNGYTRTVNSLVDNINWTQIGNTIGEGVNIITNTLYLYFSGIDWVNIGNSLATGLNGIIDSIDWDILGRTIGVWIMKIPKIIYGFVTTLNWNSLGTYIGSALNGALKEVDGKMIAEGINGLVNGILTTIKSFIKEVSWDDVAKTIGDVLGNLDWGTLAKVGLAFGAAKLISGFAGLIKEGLIKGLTDTIGHGVEVAVAKIGLKLTTGVFKVVTDDGTVVTGFKALGLRIASAFSGAIGKISFSDIIATLGTKLSGITGVFKLLGTDIGAAFSSGGIFSAIQTGFSGLLGIINPWGLVIGAAIAGIIAIFCNWDKVKEFFTVTLPTWWNETVIPWIEGLPEFFTELPSKIYEKIITLKEKFIEWAATIWETVSTKVQEIRDGIVNFFAELPGKIGYAIGFTLGKLASWWIEIIVWATENIPMIIENIVTFFAELPGKIWDAIISAKDKFVEWAGNIWSYLSTKVPEIINNVVGFFAALPGKIWDGIKSAVGKVGEWCKNLYNKVKEEVPKITNKVIDFFKVLPGKILDIGKNIVSGFIDGIQEKWESAKKGVGDFVDGIVRGFKDGFDVHSPSRVMSGIGENVAAGLKNGIDGSSSDVLKVMDKLGDNLRNSISQSLGDMEERTARMMQNLKDEFSRTVNEADISAGNIIGAFSGLHIPIPHLSVSWDNWDLGPVSFSVPNFDIDWYANGGFPELGELFIARESGPEMVGSMAGRPAVANNDQIVEGISSAVYPAVKQAVAEAIIMTSSTASGNEQAPIIEVTIQEDCETTYKRVLKGEKKYKGRYEAVIAI
ncbi:hypothetical protein V8Q34_14625 [Blautia sp. JLR.GB0024]|uniref:phage tail protein n=1 Tax=Blautia sp. JLR.GB0024 TaxID=3123295 RepID=UPI003005130B